MEMLQRRGLDCGWVKALIGSLLLRSGIESNLEIRGESVVSYNGCSGVLHVDQPEGIANTD